MKKYETIHEAAGEGNIAKVQRYLDEDSGVDSGDDNGEGWTPLMWAARERQLDMIKFLVDKGANVNAKATGGTTALIWAAYKGQLDVVKYLVEDYGADVNAEDNGGKTALMWAKDQGKLDVVEYLKLHGAKEQTFAIPNERNDKPMAQYETIHEAAGAGNLAEVQRYIEKGAEVDSRYDSNGRTPLTDAAGKGHLEVVKYLVDKGADVNAGDKGGGTSLTEAAFYGHLDVVTFLVDKGADVNAIDRVGNTSLMWAAGQGYLNIVKYLVAKGADVNATRGIALWMAEDKGKLDVVEFLKQHKAKLKKKFKLRPPALADKGD